MLIVGIFNITHMMSDPKVTVIYSARKYKKSSTRLGMCIPKRVFRQIKT